MAHARAVEHLPVRLGDGALVAHHQRHDHARILFTFQAAQYARTQGRAARFHHIAESGHEGGQAHVGRIGARLRPHIARGAHALLQQPRLVIEAQRVRVAVRTLQAHRQLPALAWLHVAHLVRHFVTKPRVPGQGDQGRHLCPKRFFHGKIEAHALLEAVRQAGDGARDGDVPPLVGWRQLRRKRGLGQPGGPIKAQSHAGGRRKHAAPARVTAQQPRHQQRSARDHPQQRARMRRQAGLRLQPGGAGGKAEYQGTHGSVMIA